jgi:hypothetical protein
MSKSNFFRSLFRRAAALKTGWPLAAEGAKLHLSGAFFSRLFRPVNWEGRKSGFSRGGRG